MEHFSQFVYTFLEVGVFWKLTETVFFTILLSNTKQVSSFSAEVKQSQSTLIVNNWLEKKLFIFFNQGLNFFKSVCVFVILLIKKDVSQSQGLWIVCYNKEVLLRMEYCNTHCSYALERKHLRMTDDCAIRDMETQFSDDLGDGIRNICIKWPKDVKIPEMLKSELNKRKKCRKSCISDDGKVLKILSRSESICVGEQINDKPVR